MEAEGKGTLRKYFAPRKRSSIQRFEEFCCIAKGSAGELRSQVINAHDVELVNDEAYNWLHAQCEKVSGMLGNYVKHLVASAGRIKGTKFTRQSDREPFDWDAFLADMGLQRLPSGQVVRVKPLGDKCENG